MGDVAAADPRWCILLLRYFNPVGAHPSGGPQPVPAAVLGIVAGFRAGGGALRGSTGWLVGEAGLCFLYAVWPMVGQPALHHARACAAGRIGEHPQMPTNLMPCITEAVLGRRPKLQARAQGWLGSQA